MRGDVKVAASVLSADFSRLGEEVRAVTSAGADWVHLDVMDGRFVPNLTFGPPLIKALQPHTTLPFDVHLMVVEPERMLADYVAAGATSITVHQEVSPHLHRTLTHIRELGCGAGVALNPSTPVETLEHVLGLCDLVLIMTVNPGFGGQTFIPEGLEKIRRLRQLANRKNPELLISVDGGVNSKTKAAVREAGADVLVAGSAIFSQPDYAHAIRLLRDSSTA